MLAVSGWTSKLDLVFLCGNIPCGLALVIPRYNQQFSQVGLADTNGNTNYVSICFLTMVLQSYGSATHWYSQQCNQVSVAKLYCTDYLAFKP